MTLESKHLLIAATAVVLSAAGLARAQTTVPGHLPRNGLVAFWTADGHARDSAGKNHGKVGPGVAFTADRHGKAKGAFLFNGKSGFVKIPDSAPLDTDDAFTLSAWVNPRGYVDQHGHPSAIITKWYSGDVHGDYAIHLYPNGKLMLTVWASPRKQEGHYNKSVIPKDTWTHIAATFDRGTMKLYINGRLDVTKVCTKVRRLDPAEYKYDDVRIGGLWNNGYLFTGAIDDVGIWNRALSAEEIQSVFKSRRLLAGVPQVTRKADADRVVLKDDNILLGTIENKTYTVGTFFGKLEIPARDVVGLVQADKQIPHPRLILTSGQVVAGKLTGQKV
ncbi:MAG: LamG domain-containing protein, partial [Phycisphaerae bacterium]|nr:LamG domain-containing protein [Phycisphaerae bacterium]